MSEAIGPHIDIVLQRVRDCGAALHPRAVVMKMFTHTQRIINTVMRLVISSGTLTTTPHRVFYPIYTNFSDATRVVAVRDGNRDLTRLPDWTRLNYLSRRWFRDVGTEYTAFSEIGRSFLLVYPGQRESGTLTVYYTKLTREFINESDQTEIPDEYLSLLADLTASLLLIRARDFKDLQNMLSSSLEQVKEGLIHV